MTTWDPNASLVLASAFEGSDASPALQDRRSDGDASFPVYEDPLPGDGRAPQWVLVFLADEATRTLRVTEQETVWLDEGGQPAGPQARALGGFQLDSTDAAERVREASAAFDRVVAARDASVFFTLGTVSEGPQWQVRVHSQSLGDQLIRFVDARTGEVTNRSSVDTASRTSTANGTLSEGAPNASHPVELDDAKPVEVTLAWEGQANLSAELVVQGSALEPDEASREEEGFRASWSQVPEGNHTVRMGVDAWGNRSSVDYELTVRVG